MNHKTFLNDKQWVYTGSIRYVEPLQNLFVGISDDDDFIFFVADDDMEPIHIIDEFDDALRQASLDELANLRHIIVKYSVVCNKKLPKPVYELYQSSAKYALKVLDLLINRFDNTF